MRRASLRGAARRRRVRLLAVAGAAALCLALGLLALRRRHAAERAQEAQRRERSRAEEVARAERAAAERKRLLGRAVERWQPRSPRMADLLVALAKATPPAITLRAVTCTADRFALRGHRYETGAAGAALLPRYRREFAGPEAAWMLAPAEPAGGSAGDFSWDGRFTLPETPSLTLPEWEARLAAARTAAPTAAEFDRWLAGWSRGWIPAGRSEEIWPDLVLRHYAFAAADRRLGAWSAIVGALQAASREPGLSLDSVALSVPEGGASFAQAEITLTARLRP